MRKTFYSLFSLLALLSLVITGFGCAGPQESVPSTPTVPKPANPEIIMASTTSTGDSGLMDVLIPLFQQKTGYIVKPIYVGSGAAMAMGERGEADVLLVHVPDSEVKFMQAGHGLNRKLVMHNDFVIVGPAADSAGIKGMTSALDAIKKIAASKVIFISRGDNSGTNQLELKFWKAAGVNVTGQSWYQSSGQGMGATLNIASEKGAYTITDRATYLATQKTLSLSILVEGDPVLLNIYHVIQANPQKSDKINADGARAFADFMVDPATQEIIRTFGVDKYGQPLFFPDADKTEADLGSK
ncbi:MAG: substrate-binding domain-containing protein [Chloroflexi bacterium]|nr:substrate-binding domain-containing protein [Chloroflexota bacterium]